MELVYLWVENYKNIEKQGFNFSPKFRCEYNPETNELKIEENENYVPLFPDNINITAIVGKNGSGKSSLLEAIALVANKYDTFKDKKVLLLVKDNNKFYLTSNIRDIKYYFSNLDLEFKDNILSDMIYFEYKNNQFLKNLYSRLTNNHLFIHHMIESYFYYREEITSVLSNKFKFNYFKFIIKPAQLDLKKKFAFIRR